MLYTVYMDFLPEFVAFMRELFVSTLLLAHMLLGTLLSYGNNQPVQPNAPIPASQESSVIVEEPFPAKTDTATSTRGLATSSPVINPSAKITHASTSPAAATPKPLQLQTPLIDPEAINTQTRTAIVNILCSTASDSLLKPISGSGVIIDPRGIILTNAHIGQYFLLRDYPSKNSVDCVVRMGSPARPLYHAQLIYLPPAWIDTNASQVIAEHGVGTGQDDYAFLQISGSTDPAGKLPSIYPSIGMSGQTPDTGDGILIAGYPAGFLDGITIEKSLYPTSAFTAVGQLYSFDKSSNVDVISLGGTVVAQGGASGGAAVRVYDGRLTGIIATATTGSTTASRDLRAITVEHLDRSLRAYGKGGLVAFLSSDMWIEAADFAAKTFEAEKQKLIRVLAPAQP